MILLIGSEMKIENCIVYCDQMRTIIREIIVCFELEFDFLIKLFLYEIQIVLFHRGRHLPHWFL